MLSESSDSVYSSSNYFDFKEVQYELLLSGSFFKPHEYLQWVANLQEWNGIELSPGFVQIPLVSDNLFFCLVQELE